MIVTVTLNPAVDKVLVIENFKAGSVNRASQVLLEAGGKGINVSKTIDRLGGKSKAIGILAGQSGGFIEKNLRLLGIDNDFIYIEGETRTNVKISDPIGEVITDINEPGPAVDEAALEALRQKLFENIGMGDLIVLTGSAPHGVPSDIYYRWISEAKKHGIRCVLDADGDLLRQGVEAGPYLVKPNIHELERLFGKRADSIEDIVELAQKLLQKGTSLVAVSCGEAGAVFVSEEGTVRAPGIQTTVKSTVGAGDAMVAALSHGLHEQLKLEDMVKLAVASGTATVMSYGNQPAREDVERLLQIVEVSEL